MKACIGIVSYIPDDKRARELREERLNRLLKQLGDIWPSLPIIIISQNWKDFTPKSTNKLEVHKYDKLGILKARKTLRKHFLESSYDYIILFDDDAIIEGDSSNYLNLMEENPKGFAFIKGGKGIICPYCDSQLNLCAISRFIFEREDFPDVDPQDNDGYEDRVFSTLLHFKYSKNEFDAPKGLRCNHFKNPKEKAPSTWAHAGGIMFNVMDHRTIAIEKYIKEHKELPNLKTFYLDEKNKYKKIITPSGKININAWMDMIDERDGLF